MIGTYISVEKIPSSSPEENLIYLATVTAMPVLGILTLALQHWENCIWRKQKVRISVLINLALTFLFILSRQPYAATLAMIFFLIKAVILQKKQ